MQHAADAASLEDGYKPFLRLCEVERPTAGSCGFHLSRTQWDPYPWVTGVEPGSAAEEAGLQPGDCVLEVNGEDVLGERIGQVASRVRAREDRVQLLLWNAGSDPHTATNIASSGPTPVSLQRLSACVQSILLLLECPVCLETIPPPAHQCCNGHVLCGSCRLKAERCPVCRVPLARGRCLVADKVHGIIASTFTTQPERKKRDGQDKTKSKRVACRDAKLSEKTVQLQTANGTSISPLMHLKSRLLCKASSADNICTVSKRLALNVDGNPEAASPLRTRSFSTGEISTTHSRFPALNSPDPIPEMSQQSGSDDKDLSEGSDEARSSDEEASMDVAGPLPSHREDFFHCPCDVSCDHLADALGLMSHIQEHHDGPLVQYFRPKVTLQLPPPQDDTSLTSLTKHGFPFFLKTMAVSTGAVDEGVKRHYVWLWMLGNQSDAESHSLRLSMRTETQGRQVTFICPVFPLTSSWSDIAATGRCCVLDENFLRECSKSRDYCRVKMDVEILTDCEVKNV